MKLFQVTIPNEKHREIVTALQDDLQIDNVTSVEARTSSIVTFRVEDEEMQAILTSLQKMGVGVDFGFCDVMSLTPGTAISTRKQVPRRRRAGRLLQRSTDAGTAVPVAEMYAHIESNAILSRDSLGMLVISSSIAGIGLAADSSTYVVASMLLSPMMGPILGCAFGFAIKDRNLFVNGFLNEMLALAVTLLLGAIIGAALAPYAGSLKWPTNEMKARGQAIQLIFGAAVAALSGTGVALAESNANISSVVGTAIAAALLPPTVNCGICLAYAVIGQYFTTWINVIFIYLTAVLVFKIKKVGKFQLIRRVNEGAWQNLPRLQNTPTNRSRKRDSRYNRFAKLTGSFSEAVVSDEENISETTLKRRNVSKRMSNNSDSSDEFEEIEMRNIQENVTTGDNVQSV